MTTRDALPTTFGVAVIGGGVAGTAAALVARRTATSIGMFDGGVGASTLATGAIDLEAWDEPHEPSPLSRDATFLLDALAAYVVPPRGAALATTSGVVRPARGHDAALLDVGPIADRRIGVVRCARPGWDADALAHTWGFGAIDAALLRFADESALPDADFAARHDDPARLDWLADRLREAIAGGGWDALVLPPSLGVERARADALSKRVGVPCGEALALPGGPPGLRFERARDRAMARMGAARLSARVVRVQPVGTQWRITTEDGRETQAQAVVLATGGLVGGGIAYAPSEAVLATALPPGAAPPFRLTVEAPARVGARGRPFDTPGSLFGVAPEHLVEGGRSDAILARAGVLVGVDGAVLATDGTPRGLFAAGELVADAPRTWLAALESGAASGAAAARLVKASLPPGDPRRSPDVTPASLP
jgi:glycerol-3-phosphate dehydrogenase subunit B